MDATEAMGRRMDEERRRRAAESAENAGRIGRRRALALASGLIGLAATPGFAMEFQQVRAPRANHIVVAKGMRVMELRSGNEVLKRYRVDLGFTPDGHKLASGDGRTPEGRYWIDRRNPRSEFYLSLGISYPNAQDVARAQAMGVNPGGDIFIHGEPVRRPKDRDRDWTAGCIAVTNDEMEEIWALTPTGVPITILA
jgi:murein L,D-transpeptidase YafK